MMLLTNLLVILSLVCIRYSFAVLSILAVKCFIMNAVRLGFDLFMGNPEYYLLALKSNVNFATSKKSNNVLLKKK